MSDGTKIEWADATVNAINGCSVTSPGCTNCYAMKLAGTRMKSHPTRQGLTVESKAGPVWNGEVRLHEPALLQPLAWKKPRRIFWNAHGDTFHPNVPWEWTAKVMAAAFLSPQHIHMILTKRADRMNAWFETLSTEPGAEHFSAIIEDLAENVGIECDYPDWVLPLDNVWLGVSVEDQARAEERIPDLLETPAAIRFLSCEPLLGPVDLSEWMICPNAREGLCMDPQTGAYECCKACDWTCLTFAIDWVIAGGESGPAARPMHPDWARSLRDQCAAAGVPFHFKQWGEWGKAFPKPSETPGRYAMMARDSAGWTHTSAVMLDHYPRQFNSFGSVVLERLGKKRAGRLLDGVEHNGMPGEAA